MFLLGVVCGGRVVRDRATPLVHRPECAKHSGATRWLVARFSQTRSDAGAHTDVEAMAADSGAM
jgi:hypothetical protein